MKVEMIYSQGDSPFREDGLVAKERWFFGVIDGYSEPYGPNHPPSLFNGRSGGEMVARFCERICSNFPSSINLKTLVLDLNKALGERQKNFGLSLEDVGMLAGASAAFAKINLDSIHVVQMGDCLSVVELRDGEIIVSPNQLKSSQPNLESRFEQDLKEIAGELFSRRLEELSEEERNRVRGEMYDRRISFLKEVRRENVNNPDSPQGYGSLNGQDGLIHMLWEKIFPREKVQTVLLFSDGIYPLRITEEEAEIGRVALEKFNSRGLAGLLLSRRYIEKINAATARERHAEATAIALDFRDEN